MARNVARNSELGRKSRTSPMVFMAQVDAEFTGGAGEDDQNQKHSFPSHYICSVVRGEVWPTIRAPGK